MQVSVSLEEIAQEFKLKIVGDSNVKIVRPGNHEYQYDDAIMWAKNEIALSKFNSGCVIAHESLLGKQNPGVNLLLTSQDLIRAVYSKIIHKYFNHLCVKLQNDVDRHKQNTSIKISDNCYIGEDVEIGDGTIIYPNVVIHNNTRIGKNCVIKSNVSLSTDGLGFDYLDGEFIKFPQVGGVLIGNNVEIGPLSTIRRAAISYTKIDEGTKIGSLSNIGHNCIIGKNNILTCQVVTGGSSRIGDNCFIGVNAILKNGISLGNHVTVGQGAIVTKSFLNEVVIVGSPAEAIEDYKKWSRIRKELIESYNKDQY